MRIDRAAIKHNAKLAMRETAPKAIWVALLYLFIILVLETLSVYVTGQNEQYALMIDAMRSGQLLDEFYAAQIQPAPAGRLIDLAISIMALILGAGFSLYCLNVSRRVKASVGNLFDGFGLFFKIIWLQIICYVRVALWSLLLVVPGIIEAYRQRQALFLLLDNPDMRAIDCVRQSREMMRGHKGELFVLDLSFIGWGMLCVIPFVSIWVTPYIEVTCAGYYNALLGADGGRGSVDGGDAPPVYPPKDSDEKPPWEL